MSAPLPTSAPNPVRAALISLGVGLAILALKTGAWVLTGSVALMSDALESVVNVLAATAALAALHVARRPPDDNHPFGHDKAEYFSAVFEGFLILAASVSIVWAAVGRLDAPRALSDLGPGVALAVVASGLNAVLARFLVRTGRAASSPALVADGMHVWADVVTTMGVLAGIGLAALTGWWILDPLLALVVALNVVRTGFHLVRESVGGLMDEALPAADTERVVRVVGEHLGPALQAHGLMTRRAGPRTFVNFHLVVPGEMSVRDAHDICEAIETGLAEAFGQVTVSIHVEPEGEAERGAFVVGGSP